MDRLRAHPAVRLSVALLLDVAIVASAVSAVLYALDLPPWFGLQFVLPAALVGLTWAAGRRTPSLTALGCEAIGHRTARFTPPTGEGWATLLLGALAVLQGAKELVRLPQFHVPAPLFGLEFSPAIHAAWVVATSAGSIAAGLLLLRLRRAGLVLALALAVLTLGSNALGWSRMDAYVERLIIAKRQWENAPIQPGEMDRLKRVMPLGLNGGIAFAAVGLLVLRRRFDR